MRSARVGLYAGVLGMVAVLGWGCEASVGPPHRNEPPPPDDTVYQQPNPAEMPEPQAGTYRAPSRDEGPSEDRSAADYDRRRVEDRIPSDAQAVGERLRLGEPSDRGLFYEPREDGRIFIRDEDTGRVIYSGPLREGQQFWLNLTRERAAVDGHTVFQAPLRVGDKYQLYFQER